MLREEQIDLRRQRARAGKFQIENLGKKRVFSDVAHVHFQPLSEEEIHYYIDKFKPYDKAGAYAVQEWIGMCKVSKIEGTFSNIMGLPMEALFREIEKF